MQASRCAEPLRQVGAAPELGHRVVLGEQRNQHGGIFAALALMDRAGVGRHQGVQLTPVGNSTPSSLLSASMASIAPTSPLNTSFSSSLVWTRKPRRHYESVSDLNVRIEPLLHARGTNSARALNEVGRQSSTRQELNQGSLRPRASIGSMTSLLRARPRTTCGSSARIGRTECA